MYYTQVIVLAIDYVPQGTELIDQHEHNFNDLINQISLQQLIHTHTHKKCKEIIQ